LIRSIGNIVGFLLVLAATLILMNSFGMIDLGGGSAKVIDGDSIRVNGTEIRLHGIDAPEYRQTCDDGTGKEYSCGRKARDALQDIIGSNQLKCISLEADRYGRAVANCKAGDTDIARKMVREGWAVAYIQHDGTMYARDEREARKARRGIWAGQFERPYKYRERMRRINGAASSISDVPEE
jgi:endonuclease YncB( thermonuclease family)